MRHLDLDYGLTGIVVVIWNVSVRAGNEKAGRLRESTLLRQALFRGILLQSGPSCFRDLLERDLVGGQAMWVSMSLLLVKQDLAWLRTRSKFRAIANSRLGSSILLEHYDLCSRILD